MNCSFSCSSCGSQCRKCWSDFTLRLSLEPPALREASLLAASGPKPDARGTMGCLACEKKAFLTKQVSERSGAPLMASRRLRLHRRGHAAHFRWNSIREVLLNVSCSPETRNGIWHEGWRKKREREAEQWLNGFLMLMHLEVPLVVIFPCT